MRCLRQFCLLMWKNLLIQKRSPLWTGFELLFPLLLCIIHCVFKWAVKPYRPIHTVHVEYSIDFRDLYFYANKTLYYAPKNKDTDMLMKLVADQMYHYLTIYNETLPVFFHPQGFADYQSLYDALKSQFSNCYIPAYDASSQCKPGFTLMGGIWFNNFDNSSVNYTIRMPFFPFEERDVNKYPFINTKVQYRFDNNIDSDDSGFIFCPIPERVSNEYTVHSVGGRLSTYVSGFSGYSGFVRLQHIVDLAIAVHRNPNFEGFVDSSFWLTKLRQNIHFGVKHFYAQFASGTIETGAVGTLLWFPVFLFIIRNILQEKESGMKEYMKVMGLKNWIQWLSHFLTAFIKVLFISICVAILVVVGGERAYFVGVDPSILFAFLLLSGITLILFSFLVTVFFSRVTPAIIFGVLIYFGLDIFGNFYTGNFFIHRNDVNFTPISFGVNFLCCFVWHAAYREGLKIFGGFQKNVNPVGWRDYTKAFDPDDPVNLFQVFHFLLFDMFIYVLITWYFDAVLPGKEGVPQKLWFPFQRSYWCGESAANYEDKQQISDEMASMTAMESDEKQENKPSIVIRKLSKMFTRGNVKALDNLSLNIFPQQITGLLGHNGAGKTTLMKVLSGSLAPSSGHVEVCGLNLIKSIPKIREKIGFCPQSNILLNILTVTEHLKLFCKLKNRKFDQSECDYLLAFLDLSDKAKRRVKNLSGGMKRKLQLAIALIGHSEIIFLDEPSSGLDPSARHKMWELLKEEKRNRTIVLSTHYMQEADVLSDRIAIIANGRLQCVGSSFFLKNYYGTGYLLSIVFESEIGERSALVIGLTKFIQQQIDGAKMSSELGLEVVYLLPEQQVKNFGKLMAGLEELKDEFKIDSFGVSVTDLETVFHRVDELATQEAGLDEKKPFEFSDLKPSKRNTGFSLWCEQFRGLLVARFFESLRFWVLTLAMIIVPLLLSLGIIIPLSSQGSSAFSHGKPPLVLNLRPLEPTTIIVDNDVLGLVGYRHSFEDLFFDTSKFTIEKVAKNQNLTTFIKRGQKDIGQVAWYEKYSIGIQFESDSQNHSISALYNPRLIHGMSISVNFMDQSIVRQFSGRHDFTIETINDPLPATFYTKKQHIGDSIIGYRDPRDTSLALTALFVLWIFGFQMACIVTLVVNERVSGVKHMQLLTGLSPFIYWFCRFIWDFQLLLLPIVGIIGISSAVSTIIANHVGAFLLLAILFIFAGLPLTYCISFFLDGQGKAFIITFCNFAFVGMIGFIIFPLVSKNYCSIGGSLFSLALTLLAPTNSVWSPVNLIVSSSNKNILNFCDDTEDAVGHYLLYLFISGLFWWSMVVVLQWLNCPRSCACACCYRRPPTNRPILTPDEDALEEEQFVDKMNQNDGVLVVKKLNQRFGLLKAVDNLSFHVSQTECFGLLGVNGAGKTSTFSILTGIKTATTGSVWIEGIAVPQKMRQAGAHIGFCPQFDALASRLTGKEILTLFARLRGLPEEEIGKIVQTMIHAIDIDRYADRRTSSYSGGNRRRLSLGVALIGVPPLLLLDEPTAGVDPGARRTITQLLDSLRKQGIAIVLSSHSMDECEWLCTRIGILMQGKLICIGSPQRLKSKYGTGYSIQMKMKSFDGIQGAKDAIVQYFPDAMLTAEHLGLLSFSVSRSEQMRWSLLFNKMNEMTENLEVDYYSLTQPTLEQVFLNLNKPVLTEEF